MRIQFLREMPSTPPPERGELVCVLSLRRGDVEAGPAPALSGALVTSLGTHTLSRRSLTRTPAQEGMPRLRIDRYQLVASHPLSAPALVAEGYPHRVVEVLQRLLSVVPTLALVDVVTDQALPLQHPALQEQLGLALEPLAGGLLLAPTLGGEPDYGPAPLTAGAHELDPALVRVRLWDDVQDWTEQVRGLEQLLRTHYLTGLIDIPMCPWLLTPQRWDDVRQKQRLPVFLQTVERHWQHALDQAVDELTGMDISLCTWAGDWGALLPHARRSPAALAAHTLLVQRQNPALATLERQRAALPALAPAPASRLPALLRGLPTRVEPPSSLHSRLVIARLDAFGACHFEGQSCLRAPVGVWSLPAVRTLKELEFSLRRTADQFVFRPVSETSALELVNALQYRLDSYLIKGVLAPLSTPEELITAWPERREPPALVAQVLGSLRPWCHTFRIRLSILPGGVEVQTT